MRSLGHSDMTNSESAENTKDPPPAIMDAGIQNREQKKKKKWIDFDERSVNVIIHGIYFYLCNHNSPYNKPILSKSLLVLLLLLLLCDDESSLL